MKNIKTKPMLLKKRPNKLRGRFSLGSGSLAIWLMELGKFELAKGIFHRFCVTALNDENNDYFLIIDEINRGNLSKIF